METRRNSENNEDAHMKLVLEEFISEQKYQSKSIADLANAINSLSDRFINIEEELKGSKPICVSTNMQPVQEMIKKSISEMKMVIAAQEQKPIVKKYQLLLFPEQDAKLFYKIVFGRWFLWLFIVLFLTDLYKFGVHWNDNQKELKFQLLKSNRKTLAWDYLYFQGSKGFKRKMDSAYAINSEKEY
jgi:hypothetical protein